MSYLTRNRMLGLVGGAGAIGSYGMALWAMTVAPVAMVAALRETSILFGVAILALFLSEQLGRAKIIGVCIIAAGAVALRLSDLPSLLAASVRSCPLRLSRSMT